MRPRWYVALLTAAPLLAGCLLTSDFDGITGGEPDAAVPVVVDAGFDAGPWTPTPCVGKLECLPFDDETVEPNGWKLGAGGGAGQVSRTTTDVAAGTGALYTVVPADPALATTSSALLYKYLDLQTTGSHVRWGFDARIERCDGSASGDQLGSVTLTGLQPANEGFFGLVAAPGVDVVAFTALSDQTSVTERLPQRLPRGAWFHLDLELTMAAPESTLVTSLNGAVLSRTPFPATTPAKQPLLNVGLFGNAPNGDCTATFDNYYFESF